MRHAINLKAPSCRRLLGLLQSASICSAPGAVRWHVYVWLNTKHRRGPPCEGPNHQRKTALNPGPTPAQDLQPEELFICLQFVVFYLW